VKVILDVVLNHRCASDQDEHGRWNVFAQHPAWDASAITCDSYVFGGKGSPSTGKVYEAAPNVDHTKEFVRSDYVAWLRWLRRTVKADGYRLDFVVGFGAEYLAEYIDETKPQLAIGEYWDTCTYEADGSLAYNQDYHRTRTVEWIRSTGCRSAAFDFTTKGILQEAMSKNERWRLSDPKGQPPGVIGLMPSHAVTFIDNHDTGSSLRHWPFPDEHNQEGYAYILTHPGTPCVFYDDYFSDHHGHLVRALISARKRNRLHSKSQISIHVARHNLYAATVDGCIHVKCGNDMNWLPSHAGLQDQEWRLAVSGHNFAVWEKTHKSRR